MADNIGMDMVDVSVLLNLLQENAIYLMLVSHTYRRKRNWISSPGRTAIWWENLHNGVSPEHEWKTNFRMCRANFMALCDELRPYIEKQTTRVMQPISVETQVGITLYYLSDEGGYRMRLRSFRGPSGNKVRTMVIPCVN